MSTVNDIQALTTSIGEYTLETIGRDSIKGLQVTMEDVDHQGCVSVALKDNSDAEQKRVLRELLGIEQIYFDEAALTFAFVESLDDMESRRVSAPLFSYV